MISNMLAMQASRLLEEADLMDRLRAHPNALWELVDGIIEGRPAA